MSNVGASKFLESRFEVPGKLGGRRITRNGCDIGSMRKRVISSSDTTGIRLTWDWNGANKSGCKGMDMELKSAGSNVSSVHG